MKEFIGYTIMLGVFTFLVGLLYIPNDWTAVCLMILVFGEGMLVLQKAIEFYTDRADRRRFQQILAQHTSPNSRKG